MILAASMRWYTQIPVDGHYWPNLLPAYLTFALRARFRVRPGDDRRSGSASRRDDAGLASGLINTNQQIGGAIGVALASTIFISTSRSLLTERALASVGHHLAAASSRSGR